MLNHVKSHEVAMQPEKQYLPEDLLASLTEDGSVSYCGVEIKVETKLEIRIEGKQTLILLERKIQ